MNNDEIETNSHVFFDSVVDAVKQLNLDRRYKWFEFLGEVVYNHNYTCPCIECDGGGCNGCGYHGKRKEVCPIPAIHPQTGQPVKVSSNHR